MSEQLVSYERRGATALLRLNRPDKLNAIDGGVIAALHEAMDRAEQDAGVRAIVLGGAGRAFCAGFDLKEKFDAPPGSGDPMRLECQRDYEMIMRLWDSPLPTIAAVQGYCLGGGFELMLACDLAVASQSALLGAPEARIGGGIVTLLLPWICGARKAREILLLGLDRLSAEEALAHGLVNRVVPDERLENEALAMAEQIAGNDARTVGLIKGAINGGYDRAGLREALSQGLEACIEIESRPGSTG